ncbi:methyltransferase domain-containing protein [Pedobacter sp. KR3-3]|uniref:Methyltransferase domain-containing protein n=1 Tax=Pedobacter albus TaxID=3113905 RepID=A0ABU7I9Z3_9SPHI|nr:methyltransferase domain-containing protein [Pedobacter sp. KR3-3]MEE1946310.1 methyltransferase domain-containing protein [Pedobacter sp. KR3-3]
MDVFGKALTDYCQKGKASTLWLHNSYDEPEEMPIDVFFRDEDDMPELEHQALALCKGKILDVGAGVGSHTLWLQQKGFDVTAIDISETAVEIMRNRGVKKASVKDIFTLEQRYDTLLFMMNGIGLTGTLPGFVSFLAKAKTWINPNGQLIFDSSNISYLYDDLPMPKDHYFGEVSYCYEYQEQKGKWFNWLYLDQQTLLRTAKQCGWQCTICYDDGEDQYLAKLTLPA